MKRLILLTVIALFVNFSFAQKKGDEPLKQYKGFFDFSYNESNDKILMEVKEHLLLKIEQT